MQKLYKLQQNIFSSIKVILSIGIVVFTQSILPIVVPVYATNQPAVTISSKDLTSANINAVFSENIPSGNIVDFELYDSNHQKIWQQFSTNGGSNFTVTTPQLPQNKYSLSIGLFTPNWQSNYGWYSNIATTSIPLTNQSLSTPTSTPVQQPSSQINSSIYSAALTAYNNWKSTYVQQVDGNTARVKRPENNNDTVSEGMGYGMLISVFAGDLQTFGDLWNYTNKHLDNNGLMNWDIDANGSVIGQNGATDADQDIAYALLLASKKWTGKGYDTAAKNMINAILSTEVSGSNNMTPGDGWGQTKTVNPSYLALSYYPAFAAFTGNSRWNNVASVNTSFLGQIANSNNTGLVPDWINSDYSTASISWDAHPQDFYYDALRTPIRLLFAYKTTDDTTAKNILQKESNFLGGIGSDKLVSGYSLSGAPLASYLDSAFLSAYAAAGQVNPDSSYGKTILNSLVNNNPQGYFGTSLRALTLFIISGATS